MLVREIDCKQRPSTDVTKRLTSKSLKYHDKKNSHDTLIEITKHPQAVLAGVNRGGAKVMAYLDPPRHQIYESIVCPAISDSGTHFIMHTVVFDRAYRQGCCF